MIIKKLTVLFLSLFVFLFFSFTSNIPKVSADQAGITILVDGSSITFDVDPIIENGTTMVQFRPIFEKLGLSVNWDEGKQTVTGSKDTLSIRLTLGSKDAIINNRTFLLNEAPHIVNGNTLIPLRFVGEATGKKVLWDNETKTVGIIENTPESVINELYQAFRNQDFERVVSLYDKHELEKHGVTEQQLANSLIENPPQKVKRYHIDIIVDIDSTHKSITVVEEYESGETGNFIGILVLDEGSWKISDNTV